MELLLIRDEEKEHYVYMKYFNQLMFSFSAHKTKNIFAFTTSMLLFQIDLEKHIKDCIVINGVQTIEMPKKGGKVYFKNRHKQLPAPFVIFADFEAIAQEIYSCQHSNEKSYTQT